LDKTIEQLSQEVEELIQRVEAGRKGDTNIRERKMRFFDAGQAPVQRILAPQTRKKVEEFTFEELMLGRMLLNARGGILPDALEKRFQEQAVQFRTMTEDGAATGAELVPDVWNGLLQDARAATKVANLFEQVPMTSKTVELMEMGDAVFYKPTGEGQAVTATDLVTAKRLMTAYELKAQVDVGDRLDEDAAIQMLPSIRARLVLNAAEAIDEAVLCADASTGKQNINYYAATGGSDLAANSRFLLGFDGLLHYCLNEVTGQGSNLAALTTDDFLTLISLLDKYADNPDRCVFIMDRYVKNKAIGLSDFQGVEKLGAQASLLTGQIGVIYGSPVVMSGALLKSNATGQVDQTGGSNTKGRVVLVNRDMWKVGFRRTVQVRSERSESKGLTSLVCSFRMGLQCLGDRSTATYCHAALGFDTTV
jgi:HK97 family phage major capsid protein